jgi:hypothetical protein
MTQVVDAQAHVSPRSRLARFFGQTPLSAETRVMYRAAIGELLVGDMLDNLGPRWDVLHVVPMDGVSKDIDHLVIGPPGVFAIVTENFPGQEVKVNGDSLSVGGQQFDDIVTARQLGERAAELLGAATSHPVVVSPLLVIVGSTKLALREQPDGVTVVGSRQLLHYLEKLERTLHGTEIARISDVADRGTTWQALPDDAPDVQQLSHDFGELKSAVQEATQARVFWAVVGFAVAAICVWVSTALVVQHLLPH